MRKIRTDNENRGYRLTGTYEQRAKNGMRALQAAVNCAAVIGMLLFVSGIVCAMGYHTVQAEGKAASEELGLEDGEYTADVILKGGSGKTAVETPAVLEVKDREVTATIIFSSPNYDYMLVNGEKYMPVNTEGNSAFKIPVDGFDYPMPVIADTVAMSEPHEITYTLQFDSSSIRTGANAQETDAEEGGGSAELQNTKVIPVKPAVLPGLTYDHRMELLYAQQFVVDYYEGGYALISVADGGKFLVVPEEAEVPEALDSGITVLQQPLQNIYLVATSAMDLFRSIDGIGNIRLSGTKEEGWYIPEAKEALQNGAMIYAGKYNAPDYELILKEGCDLAVESTMIYHNPEVKEKLEQFGIPVLVERSSYETHPLGKTEWMKLYAVLLGKEALAEQSFQEQAEKLKRVQSQEASGKTVAFFFINSVGAVNVRKSNDYIANMIRLAGGNYIPEHSGSDDNALSTINMQMEEFYASARDADYMIYNSAIDGELTTLSQLLEKSPLMGDFKAVKDGNVWCTDKNLFQETTGLGSMTEDIHDMLTGSADESDELTYMHRLK